MPLDHPVVEVAPDPTDLGIGAFGSTGNGESNGDADVESDQASERSALGGSSQRR